MPNEKPLSMFPEIEPYNSGFLAASGGNHVYWEESGNPKGKPAVVLHGGPGSGCTPNNRRYFDPDAYRIIVFDQRNCGRSRPHASEPNIDLSDNTTASLVADMERIRVMLGIEKWLVLGASWGSVLALAYAEHFPERVSELILISVGLGRNRETNLMTEGFRSLFPEAWNRFAAFGESDDADGNLIQKYNRLLFREDPAIRERAATEWVAWEMALLPTQSAPNPRFDSPEYRLAFARLVTHYWGNGSWLEDNEILENAHKLAGIPGVILQGRLDLSNLSGSPWQLDAAWPSGELVFVEESGHEGGKAFSEALLEWTNRLSS